MWNKLEEIPILKKGGIHIKKKNRGKFTESANRAGMGVQEFANHVLANKDKYSPTLVKRANFARNAKKFKHECGGILKAQQGTGNLFSIKPGSPLDQAWQAANEKLKYPGVKQIVGPDGNKVAIRSEESLKPVYISEYLPGTGDVAEIVQIQNDLKDGNTGSAMLGAGLFLLPGNASKLLPTNISKKVGNFLDKKLFNFDNIIAKLKHPTWQKYYHGSDTHFDIKNADMGYNGEVGLHMTRDPKVAQFFARGYSDQPGKVYEFYAPKPTLQTIDAHNNDAGLYISSITRKGGEYSGIFDSSHTNTFFEKLLKKYGGEDVIQDVPINKWDRQDLDFNFPGTGDNLKKYTLKQDVTIPTKDEIWPDKPTHVKEQFDALGQKWDSESIDPGDAAREVSKILSNHGHKVLKYENVNPIEGLKTSYVLTDPTSMYLINPRHSVKMKHVLTGAGAGLGIGYGISKLKDE